MASFTRATPRATSLHPHNNAKPKHPLIFTTKTKQQTKTNLRIRVSSSGDKDNSYLDLWKKAVVRERKETEFQRIAENLANIANDNDNDDDDDDVSNGESREELEKKSEEFKKILEVSKEERDRVQRMQVVDRAAAAIAAARAVIKESNFVVKENLIAEDVKSESGKSKTS